MATAVAGTVLNSTRESLVEAAGSPAAVGARSADRTSGGAASSAGAGSATPSDQGDLETRTNHVSPEGQPASSVGSRIDEVEVEPVAEGVSGGESKSERAKDVKSAKMAPQEELSLKITEGLSTLSGLLDRIDGKLSKQNEHGTEMAKRLEALPVVLRGMVETQQASLDAIRDVRGELQRHGEQSQERGETLAKLPGLMEGIGGKVDEQNLTAAKVQGSVETVGKSVRSLADSSQRAQNTMMAEFRRAQDDHRRRLEELVDRERKTIFVVAGLALLVVVCLVLILVNQASG